MLSDFSSSTNKYIHEVGVAMRAKYHTYWACKNVNPFLFVVVLLDPRYKEAYLRFAFKRLSGGDEEEAIRLTKNVVHTLQLLFEQYKQLNAGIASPPREVASSMGVDGGSLRKYDFSAEFEKEQQEAEGGDSKTEMDRYLIEPCESRANHNFDILDWWRLNSMKYKIMALIARDVLAIPISTVASESTFSNSGRVLGKFRSSLLPKTLEALICAQNWLSSSKPIDLDAYVKFIDDLEKDSIEGPQADDEQVLEAVGVDK